MYLNCSRVKGRVATHETESPMNEQFQTKVTFNGELVIAKFLNEHILKWGF